MTPHRIRRQRWQVRAGAQTMAFAVKRRLRGQWDTVLKPCFERAFDRLGVGETVVRIPRLTVRLDWPAGAEFDCEGAFALNLEERLVDALRQALEEHSPLAESSRATVAIQRRGILLGYLTTGRLAWDAPGATWQELSGELREEAAALADSMADGVVALDGSLAERCLQNLRWLQLLDEGRRVALLDQAGSRWETVVAENAEPSWDRPLRRALAQWLKLAMAETPGDYPRLRAQALRLALREADLSAPAATLAQLAEWAGLAWDDFAGGEAVHRAEPATQPPQPTEPGELAFSSGELAPAGPSGPTPAPDGAAPQQPAADVPAAAGVGSTPGTVAELAAAWAFFAPGADAPAEADFLIEDAGLVLLHPFLPRLFTATGLSAADGRLQRAHLPRAAALLHWLAVGRAEVYEFELGLAKLLLGLAPDAPLPIAAGLLSSDDRAEADHLLQSTIQHWAALGHTSVHGLRQSFLQRHGLLRNGTDGWLLQVEPRAYDVLMGRLPWSLSLVRLPWMAKPLYTEWPTP